MIELAAILVLGIFAQWFAWRIKMPAILPLILVGLLVGPLSTLITADGSKLINGDEIFTGQLLFSFVSLSVGVILFEGGLTLNLNEVRNLANTVRNLLTIGVVVTSIGVGLTAHWLLDLDIRIAFLFGALMIVSGPTVISPILRNVRPNQKINTILKWESILIDPLGALIAVLVFEFIRSSKTGGEYTFLALQEFFIAISIGFFIGVLGALLLYTLIRKNRIPAYLRNVVSLAILILAFAFSETLQKESGLLTATVMGITLANMKLDEVKYILSFKEDISLILLSLLFILLSSRIDIEQITQLGWESLIVLAMVIFLIRPLAVFLSTLGSNLSFKEQLFLAWIGPRGIVAAAIASLFSLELIQMTAYPALAEEAKTLVPLTFLIIVGTVIIQGSSANLVARWLGVVQKEPQGVLFIGANEAARFISKYLKDHGVNVLLTDTAHANITEARSMGLPVYEGNIFSERTLEDIDLSNIGRAIAITSNTEINLLACKRLARELGESNVYRIVSRREADIQDLDKPEALIFGGKVDFINLIQKLRKKPTIKTKTLEGTEEYQGFLKNYGQQIVPLFIKTKDGRYQIVSNHRLEISSGDQLIYLLVSENATKASA